MSNTGQTTLSEIIAQGPGQARSTADSAIGGLAEIADDLDMRETASSLRKAGEQLRSDTFKLIVMGRFKNGKSTLLNALLGGSTRPVTLEGHMGPMVVNDLPATATLTRVLYADEPYVRAWGFDEKWEPWSFARYLRESTLDTDEQENERRFGGIREFEMGYPARLCKEGVLVYDSPGLDEHNKRTLVTREATRRCDAAVIVYRSDSPMGQSELEEAASAVHEGAQIFTVVNLWGGRQVDDRLRSFVWNRYVRDHLGGSDWNHQDLSQRDVYFIDADQARQGRYDDDGAKVEASGLADFERALAKFLLEDRQWVHLEKFVTRAGNLSEDIDRHISQRRKAAQQGQEDLRAAYAEVLPKLAAIRARPEKLTKIFARYRADAEATATASFAQCVARIRADLPGHLEELALPSGEKHVKVVRQKKLKEEAAAAISEFVTGRMDRWSNEDVKAELAPALERLADEINDEIAAIGRQFEEIHLDLGWSGPDGGSAVRMRERVLAAAAGLLLGSPIGAVFGAAGGWRGTAGSIAGILGSAFLMGLFGVSSITIFGPGLLAGALVMGSIATGAGLEKRIKEKALKQCDEMLARLPEQSRSVIVDNLAESFEALETAVTKEVSSVIAEEERHIAQAVELNQSEQKERDQAIAALTEAEAALARHRLALQQALVISRQTSFRQTG